MPWVQIPPTPSMKLIESTINASHLSDSITLDDETFGKIVDWVGTVDRTPKFTEEESYTGEYTTINGYKIEVEVFANTSNVSIIDVEDNSEGVLLRVNELMSITSEHE